MDGVNKKVDDIGARIGVIEKEPGENAKYYRKIAITAVFSTLIGAVVTAIIALIIK